MAIGTLIINYMVALECAPREPEIKYFIEERLDLRNGELIMDNGKFKTCVEGRVCRIQAHLVLSGVLLDSIFLGAIRYHKSICPRGLAESIAANLKKLRT